MMGFYFDKYRNLAFGLVTMSVGIGQMWIAPLINFLISYYGWRGTFVVLSGIVSHFAITGAVLRPVDFKEELVEDGLHQNGESKVPLTSNQDEEGLPNKLPYSVTPCLQNVNCSNNGTDCKEQLIPYHTEPSVHKSSLSNGHTIVSNAKHSPVPHQTAILHKNHIRMSPEKFHSSASIYLEKSNS